MDCFGHLSIMKHAKEMTKMVLVVPCTLLLFEGKSVSFVKNPIFSFNVLFTGYKRPHYMSCTPNEHSITLE